MGRIARKCLDTSFFHVIVQGINKEYIFKNEKYINRYIKLFNEKINKENLEIIAFCIMNNHAHFLIHTENIQYLSKFMQKLNSAYARYYNYMENRVGYVFRDRYKSEPITSKTYLIHCIKYIHQNPVKANMVKNTEEYKYSTSNQYKNMLLENKIPQIFSKEEFTYICDDNIQIAENFMDIDVDIKEIMENSIKKFIDKENIKLFEILENNDILKGLIKYLKTYQNIKYVDIMRFLDITKGTMERFKR